MMNYGRSQKEIMGQNFESACICVLSNDALSIKLILWKFVLMKNECILFFLGDIYPDET